MTALPFLMICLLPIIVTGAIGHLDRLAIKLLPFLNGPISPSSERVPSGKMIIEDPSFSFSRVLLKASKAFLRSPLSTGM